MPLMTIDKFSAHNNSSSNIPKAVAQVMANLQTRITGIYFIPLD